MRYVNDQEVIQFLKENSITRFGIPMSLVFDNETYFSSLKLYDFSLENGIVLRHASNYYPQGNGLAESTATVHSIAPAQQNRPLFQLAHFSGSEHFISWQYRSSSIAVSTPAPASLFHCITIDPSTPFHYSGQQNHPQRHFNARTQQNHPNKSFPCTHVSATSTNPSAASESDIPMAKSYLDNHPMI